MLEINQMIKLNRDIVGAYQYFGKEREMILKKGLSGIIEEVVIDKCNGNKYGVKFRDHNVTTLCNECDLMLINFEEVIGEVVDVDYGHYYIGEWGLSLYEGKKVRLRIEVIE